jgi:DNA-binding beta-propeller fold protein YncE
MEFISHNEIRGIDMKKPFLISLFIYAILILLTCEKESPTRPPIPKKGSVYGIVIDTQTNLPVVSAIVVASQNQIADTTDSLGAFALKDLSAGQETLQVNAAGFESQTKIIDIKPDSQWVEFSLKRVQENLYLYVGTFGGNDLFVVDVDSMKKEDSLYFSPGNMFGLHITPGGTKIYVTQEWPDSSVYYLDTKNKTYHLTNLPNGSIYLNNNREGFLFSNEGIFRLDTLTNQAQQIDTLTFVQFVAFDNSSSTFYFENYQAKLCQYDYEQKELIDTVDLPPAWNMTMTPDNRELYFTAPSGYLGVINIESGAVDYITPANPSGQVAITPDGQYVLVTDPGSNFPPNPGSGLLMVVRTSDHQLDGYIDVKAIAGDNPTTSEIVITPSCNYAFIANSYGGDIFIIDIRQRKAIKRLEFRPIGATISSLVLGSKPKP